MLGCIWTSCCVLLHNNFGTQSRHQRLCKPRNTSEPPPKPKPARSKTTALCENPLKTQAPTHTCLQHLQPLPEPAIPRPATENPASERRSSVFRLPHARRVGDDRSTRRVIWGSRRTTRGGRSDRTSLRRPARWGEAPGSQRGRGARRRACVRQRETRRRQGAPEDRRFLD